MDSSRAPSNKRSFVGDEGVDFPAAKRNTLSESSLSEENVTEGEVEVESIDKLDKIAGAMRTIIECLGEDPNRDGLLDTPMRAAKALSFFCSGYKQSASEVVGSGVFKESTDSNIVMAYIAYQPSNKLLGLSKLARIADVFARRLQVQERLTSEIADAVMDCAEAQGVAVMIEARHMCMAMRGVQKVHASTATTCFLGSFETNSELKSEFFSLMNAPSSS